MNLLVQLQVLDGTAFSLEFVELIFGEIEGVAEDPLIILKLVVCFTV